MYIAQHTVISKAYRLTIVKCDKSNVILICLAISVVTDCEAVTLETTSIVVCGTMR